MKRTCEVENSPLEKSQIGQRQRLYFSVWAVAYLEKESKKGADSRFLLKAQVNGPENRIRCLAVVWQTLSSLVKGNSVLFEWEGTF